MFFRRLGAFFLFIGVGLIAIYIVSDLARTPDLLFLLSGTVLSLTGFFLRRSHKPPPPPSSGRFRLLKRKRKKDEKEE
jgi:hypothetical protein